MHEDEDGMRNHRNGGLIKMLKMLAFKLLPLLATCCIVSIATCSSNTNPVASVRSVGGDHAGSSNVIFSSLRRRRPQQGLSRSGLPLSMGAAMTTSMPATLTAAAFLSGRNAAPSPLRCSSLRPSTVVPALPNQFGHERLSPWSSPPSQPFSIRCNNLHNRCHSTCHRGALLTKLYAKQVLDENTTFSTTTNLDNEESNNIKNDGTIIELEANPGSIATISDSSITNEDTQFGIPKEFIPILALCIIVTFLSALDRVAMSIAILPISSEFGYTDTIKGQISSAVSYGYGLAIVPIGLAVSVASSRLLMLGGVFLWSCATLGTPLMAELSNAKSVGDATTMFLLPLLLVRAVMGAAEAVVLPTMQRILANWVPPEKKATALAIIISGFQMGTVGAYLVSPLVLDFMSGLDGGLNIPGWRGMFYLYGLAGLLWMVPWWFIGKDAPTNVIDVVAEENCEETFVNNMIEDDASLVLNECELEPTTSRIDGMKALLQSAPWTSFLTSSGVWAMTLAHAAKNWELYTLLAWTPTFFAQHYGLNVKESALFSVVPSLCGMVGGLTAGNAADYILKKYVSDDGSLSVEEATEKRTQVRKLFQSAALLGPATCLYLLSNLPEEATTAQVLLGGAVGLQAFDAAGFGAATQEKAGERWAGLLYSLTSLPGVMVGSLSVSITGQLLDMMPDKDAGWTAVFQLNSAVCVVGALCFLFLYDSKKEFD